MAWPSWQWIFWLARWLSGLAHLPGICLPEALPCSNSHLGLGLLLRPGPGKVLPAGVCLALGFSARLGLGPSSPWPSFPVLRLSGPGPRKQEEGWVARHFYCPSARGASLLVRPLSGQAARRLAQGLGGLLRFIVSLSFSPKSFT